MRQVADKAGVTQAGMDHFYKVMRAMGQWEMLDEPSPKVTICALTVRTYAFESLPKCTAVRYAL